MTNRETATVEERLWVVEGGLAVEAEHGNAADVDIGGQDRSVVMGVFLEHEEQRRWEM